MPHDGNITMSKLPEPYARPVDLQHQRGVLTLDDFWVRCLALGTTNTPEEIAAFLRGDLRPTRHEHNLVAVALNEYLIDIDVSPFVPYIEDATALPLRIVLQVGMLVRWDEGQ